MRQHFTSKNGYDRWVDLERELSVYIAQDGSFLISLPDGYTRGQLLTPEQTEIAVRDFCEYD